MVALTDHSSVGDRGSYGDRMRKIVISLLSLDTAKKYVPQFKGLPIVVNGPGWDVEGLQENALIRWRSRSLSTFSSSELPPSAICKSLKYRSNSKLTIKTRFQLAAILGLDSDTQIDSTRFDVRTPRAHLRCLASPGGDHSRAATVLKDISSPVENVWKGAGSFVGNSVSAKTFV